MGVSPATGEERLAREGMVFTAAVLGADFLSLPLTDAAATAPVCKIPNKLWQNRLRGWKYRQNLLKIGRDIKGPHQRIHTQDRNVNQLFLQCIFHQCWGAPRMTNCVCSLSKEQCNTVLYSNRWYGMKLLYFILKCSFSVR
jgi:hypothetical protein